MKIARFFAVSVASIGLAWAQSPLSGFEAATIKPTDPNAGNASISRTGTQLTITGYTPRMLIQWAYDLGDDRLLGRSRRLDAEHYDVVARTPEQPRPGQLQSMMQSLLVERFKLVLHREQRNLPFFALTVDPAGSKVQISAPANSSGASFGMTQPGHLTGTNVTMAMLANVLSNQTGRSVQDFTNIAGIFDFKLAWTPEDSEPLPDALPSIFTAVREQLGLKIESRKGQVEVIVIDDLASQPVSN